MQRRKNNQFSEKFKSLNSQEYCEEVVIQTSSDSSDYENVQNNIMNISAKKVCKRKRKCNQKVPKNISNLNISIYHPRTNDKNYFHKQKSPILLTQKTASQLKHSPILKPLQITETCSKIIKQEPDSPILTCNLKTSMSDAIRIKSPVLTLKYSSPKSMKKVKKQLFSDKYPQTESTSIHKENILNNNSLQKSKAEDQLQNISTSIIKEENNHYDTDCNIHENENQGIIKSEIFSEEISNSRNAIANNIKSYFENNFGSDSASQHSISDIITQKSSSKNSEDIEILTLVSQDMTNRHSNDSIQEIKQEVPTRANSYESLDYLEKPRKIKYKKDGLAYRLNILLRKHNSIISLWQHERFLAENSNFVIPKTESALFCVLKVNFSYGCFVVEATNIDSEQFIIIINRSIVLNENITPGVVLKIYLPYKVLDHLEFKIVLNICKFECVTIKK